MPDDMTRIVITTRPLPEARLGWLPQRAGARSAPSRTVVPTVWVVRGDLRVSEASDDPMAPLGTAGHKTVSDKGVRRRA